MKLYKQKEGIGHSNPIEPAALDDLIAALAEYGIIARKKVEDRIMSINHLGDAHWTTQHITQGENNTFDTWDYDGNILRNCSSFKEAKALLIAWDRSLTDADQIER